MNIAINGFGRIGKNFLRTLFVDGAPDTLNPVVLNVGPGSIDHAAYAFKYDTILGTYPGSVDMDGNTLVIDGHSILVIAECDPKKLPWKELNINWVVDCSGCYTSRERAEMHRTAGAERVLISAPACDEDVTIIPGVNDAAYTNQSIVSMGSCTTNALAPMLKVLDSTFGITSGIFTTIHSYTNSQVLLDVECKQLRNSRAAALNTIPTTTGASKIIGTILPQLANKVIGSAVRVPTAVGSLLDVIITTEKQLSVDAINQAFIDAAQGPLKNILSVSDEPIVSSDINGVPYSVVIDTLLTSVQGPQAKVSGWYDNEWAYSMRLKDFLLAHS